MQYSTSKNKYIDRLIIILFLGLLSIIIFKDSLFFDKEFGWYNDQVFQYNIFYEEWYRIIKETINNGIISPYSWNLFLGTDFFVTKLFTVTGDIFALFAFIFFEINNISKFLTIETILCIILSGLFMHFMLEEMDINNRNLKLSLSIIYALSGFVVVFIGTYMFHRFYAFMPLLFMYTERFIKNKRSYGFIIVVAILFLQNYELMFSLSLYLIIYFIMSYKLKYQDDKISIVLKKSLKLIIYYFIGIMIVGFALIPLLLYIKSSTRVGTFDYGNILWNFDVIVGFISNLFFPPFNIRNDNPLYLFFTDNYYGHEYSFYVTALIIFSFIMLHKNASDKEKKIFYISELIILIFLFIRPLNMIVHGFSVPTFRWSLILIIHHIFLIAYIFNKYKYNSHHYKEITILIIIFMLLMMANMYIKGYNLKSYLPSVLYVLLFISLLYVYEYLIYKNINYSLYFGVISTVLIFILSTTNNLKFNYDQGEAFNREYLDYFMTNDEDEMFRYYFDSDELRPFNFLNLNNSLKYNYMSTTTYDSAYEYVLNDFLDMNNIHDWIIDINDPELLKMLGVKYIGFEKNNSLIQKLEAEYSYNLNEYTIYKIKDYNNIGHTYSDFIKKSESKNYQINWNNQLIVEDKDYEILKDITKTDKYQMDVLEYSRQFMRANIDVPSKQVLMITIPYSDGWNIYDQNGNKIDKMIVQGGFLGLIIDENINEISMYYATPGLKVGLLISGVGILGFIFIVIYEQFIKFKTRRH